MEKETTAVNALPKPLADLASKLDQSIINVLGQENLLGFEKAFLVADAIKNLKELLSPEYMQPIMQLQGNKLGFKTDKDKEGGYPESVVKNCLIEAVLFGIQPYGNMFNIIKGNMYVTKEGFGFLLKKMSGLWYEMTPELPRISGTSSATIMNIRWKLNGVEGSQKLDVPIKVDSYMGIDAILGKCHRKARKWLYDTLTGSDIPEGDAIDTATTVISSAISKSVEALSAPTSNNLAMFEKTVILDDKKGEDKELDKGGQVKKEEKVIVYSEKENSAEFTIEKEPSKETPPEPKFIKEQNEIAEPFGENVGNEIGNLEASEELVTFETKDEPTPETKEEPKAKVKGTRKTKNVVPIPKNVVPIPKPQTEEGNTPLLVVETPPNAETKIGENSAISPITSVIPEQKAESEQKAKDLEGYGMGIKAEPENETEAILESVDSTTLLYQEWLEFEKSLMDRFQISRSGTVGRVRVVIKRVLADDLITKVLNQKSYMITVLFPEKKAETNSKSTLFDVE